MNIFFGYFKQSGDQPIQSFVMVKRMSSLGQPSKSRKRLFSAVMRNDFKQMRLVPNQSASDSEVFC